MTDKKQLIIPPSQRLPAAPRTSHGAMPVLTNGNSAWPFEVGRYERNARAVAASTRFIDAKTAQYAAFAAMVEKKEKLMLALANYDDLPDKIAHQRTLGRMTRTAELHRDELQNQITAINLQIELAAANMQLAQYMPVREAPPAPAVQPPPVPTGFSAEDVIAAVDDITEHMQDFSPETRKHFMLLLSGYLGKEKRK
jgi:hypothetical protein